MAYEPEDAPVSTVGRTPRAPPGVVGLLLAAAWAFGTEATALADGADDSASRTVAESLFDEGRRLMIAGDTARACPKLAEAYRIGPGIGALLNLAMCHALQGKTATAWGDFDRARSLASQANREKNVSFAREQMARLEARFSRVTIVAENAPSGVVLELDGRALGAGVLASSFPVDPGHHELVVHAPGRRPWTGGFEVPPGPTEQTVRVPPLPVAAPSASANPVETKHDELAVPPGATEEHPGHTAAWIFGGIALAGLGVGTGLGLVALSKNGDADAQCQGPGGTCSPAGVSLGSQARAYGWASTAAFAVGLGGGAGVALSLLLRSSKASAVRVHVLPLGAGIEGTF